MNLSAMQIRLNYRKRDTTENFVTYDEAKAYMNEGLRRINSEGDFEFERVSASLSFTTGSSQYQLSAIAPDFKAPISVFYTDDYNFRMVTPDEVKAVSALKTYNVFAIANDKMYIGTSFGTATLQFNYYTTYVGVSTTGGLISALSSALDQPLLPERWQDMIVDYAAARCYQKEKLNDDYTIAMNDFLKSLNSMKKEYPSSRVKPLKRMSMGMQFGYTDDSAPTKYNVFGN